MSISSWKYQIKRGTLEFCIMSMIMQQPTYGYEIIGELQKYPILAAKANVSGARMYRRRTGTKILFRHS